MIMNKKMLAGMLLAGAAMFSPVAASAQVAGMASTSKVVVIMSSKAFQEGYKAVQTQNAEQYTQLGNLGRELDALIAPLDTNKDGDLNDKDADWMAALNQRSVLIKSLDKNKDGDLTGTEIEELRAKNLPAQQIVEKRQMITGIRRNIKLAELYVVEQVNQRYAAALNSVVVAKKINAVFAPNVFEWAPPAINITAQVVAALDKALPAIALPIPNEVSATQDSIALQEQIDGILDALEQQAAQRAAQQAQQGGQPGAAPAPGQPAPQPAPGEQPDSR